jgi:hypothetical protein
MWATPAVRLKLSHEIENAELSTSTTHHRLGSGVGNGCHRRRAACAGPRQVTGRPWRLRRYARYVQVARWREMHRWRHSESREYPAASPISTLQHLTWRRPAEGARDSMVSPLRRAPESSRDGEVAGDSPLTSLFRLLGGVRLHSPRASALRGPGARAETAGSTAPHHRGGPRHRPGSAFARLPCGPRPQLSADGMRPSFSCSGRASRA